MKVHKLFSIYAGFHFLFFITLYAVCNPEHAKVLKFPDEFLKYSSDNFNFYYTEIDQKNGNIKNIAEYVETKFSRIVNELKPDYTDKIDIWLYPVLSKLHQAIGWPDAPSWVRGSITGKNVIRIISPNCSEIYQDNALEPDFESDGKSSRKIDKTVLRKGIYDYALSCLVHETVHCISLWINPNLETRHRWLWEGVAVYWSGQFVNPKSLSYIKNKKPPSLNDFNNINDIRVYEVAYTYIEFILDRWGIESVRQLIKSSADISHVLKISQQEFESAWYDFINQKYLRSDK